MNFTNIIYNALTAPICCSIRSLCFHIFSLKRLQQWTAAQNICISTQLPDVSSWNTKLITEVKYDIIKPDPSVLFPVTGAVREIGGSDCGWNGFFIPRQIQVRRGPFVTCASAECHPALKPLDKKIICPDKKNCRSRTWLELAGSWAEGRSSSCTVSGTCQTYTAPAAASSAGRWSSGSFSGALCGCSGWAGKTSAGGERIRTD